MKILKKILLIILIAAALVLFYIGEIAPYSAEGETPADRAASAAPDETFIPEETPEVYVISYVVDGQNYYSEKVFEGSLPKEKIEVPESNFLGWQNENGEYVNVEEIPVTESAVYTAAMGPKLKTRLAGYFPCETDGLFYPERELTRSEFAQILANVMETIPAGTVTMTDVKDDASYKKAAAGMVSAGYMELSGEFFRPNIAITKEEMKLALSQVFNAALVEKNLNEVGDTVTRGEAAVMLNGILLLEKLPAGSTEAYYPDVPDTMSCSSAVALAGTVSELWAPAGERCEAGFFNSEGYLYCIDDNGYLLRNTEIGTLQFGDNYRFTSGDEELDNFVAERIAVIMKENPSASRDDLLRLAYEYVRDNNNYLKGKHYEVGENGWEIEEALKLFSKKLGNCYSFAAEFWALARGLGYDTRAISGLISHTYQDHGWVEIEFDGEPYVFDVEQEGIYYRQGHDDYSTSMYKMDYTTASQWSYIRNPEDVPDSVK